MELNKLVCFLFHLKITLTFIFRLRSEQTLFSIDSIIFFPSYIVSKQCIQLALCIQDNTALHYTLD